MDLREEINSFILDLLVEGVETKNMRLAKHYLYDSKGFNESQAMRVIGGIKSDIPNSRLGKCKFMLALVRMFCAGEIKDYNVIDGLNKSLKYAASVAHIDEYDNNLNGLSAYDFIKRFSGVVSNGLENDKQEVSSDEYVRNSEYDIIRINSFEESEEYGEYVDWCVTYDKNMYNSYTKGGSGVFYFCLRDGFEDEEAVEGDGCPLDSYGLSMVAVSVNSDGSCNTITCRWNHANGGNDNIMDTKQLSQLLGVNFYDVFKPLTPEEIEAKKREVLYEVEEELCSYMGYETPEDCGCDKREYDPEYGDKKKRDAYVYLSDAVDGCVLIDSNWNLLCNEIFDRINAREGDVMSVFRGNDMNFIDIDGRLLSNEWFIQVHNEFKFGIGLVKKEGKWNAMRKDGTYLFDEWYDGIDLRGKYGSYPELLLINNKLFMSCDLDGRFRYDRWYSYSTELNDYNLVVKFDGDNFYTLVDKFSHKVKSDCKINSLRGRYQRNIYLVELIDGNFGLVTENGNVYDYNTKKLLYPAKK